ncbi:MAG: hypothetical protein PHS86_11590 [Syntrophaceae bacterium]|nr:hypothetical protein [Syntrophaceae bacterium]
MSRNEQIERAVKAAEKGIREQFTNEPERFFTESDLVAAFYNSLIHNMVGIKDINPAGVVHQQYPTLFKCDMKGGRFIAKDDNSAFKRGHYDLVILNPDFVSSACRLFPDDPIARFNYLTARFWMVKKHRDQYIQTPPILYAFEFMYQKDPINERQTGGIKNLLKLAQQDFLKLKHSQSEANGRFIKNAQMLVFIKDTPETICNRISDELKSISKGEIACIAGSTRKEVA